MATYAKGYYPRIVTPAGGRGQNRILRGYLEADSQTFVRGSLVYLSSGAVTVVPDSGATIAGIARTDATNVTSGNIEIPIELIYGDTEVRIRCYNNTAEALASGCTGGTAYGLHLATDLHYLDINDSDNVVTFIDEYLNVGEASGDTYYALVQFVPAALQFPTGV